MIRIRRTQPFIQKLMGKGWHKTTAVNGGEMAVQHRRIFLVFGRIVLVEIYREGDR